MYQEREKTLGDLVTRINALRSKLRGKQPDEQILTDRSRLMGFKEVDALPIEHRRKYLSYVPVKAIVDLTVEIEAKETVLGKVERDVTTQEWVETQNQ